MRRVYDDERLAGAYHAGNEMPPASLRAWTELIGSCSPRPGALVLDLGAGTGMFATAMARWLPVRGVVGIDPSVPMLTQARRNAHPRVRYAVGAAESLPARSHVFGVALLSRVIHHLTDRRACAGELRRVLRPGGTTVIRTTFRENLDAPVYRYWPRVLDSDRERFPGRDDVVADFAAAGFSVTRLTSFAQPATVSLREYRDRMATRPASKFACLTEAEFRAGLERLDRDALAEPATRPAAVRERYDVLVLTAG